MLTDRWFWHVINLWFKKSYQKVRVINLTQGGEAMEERGNLAYLSDGKEAGGKRERIASNEMCGSVK